MEEENKIDIARSRLLELMKLGETLNAALPYMQNTESNLAWYAKVCEEMPTLRTTMMETIDGTLNDIMQFQPSNFSLSGASASNATILTASTLTMQTIQESGPQYKYLIQEHDKINPYAQKVKVILQKVGLIHDSLYREFEEAKDCYSRWKSNYRTNSDLAKDVRTFQEHFKGYLNKLRVPMVNWKTVKVPDYSWNKIVEDIGKKGSESQRAFMTQRKIGEDCWEQLTPVLKKTADLSREEMEVLYKKYVDHVYAVLNLIDDKVLERN